ncbi:MAG: NAD(P)H-dependent oxidoreductase [Pseudomonadales bacterium]|jgi:multimeric flavodoxin WrbA|nr:NAD(P)H-dependent oxidoreductase [Pseudomonadales bacterium]
MSQDRRRHLLIVWHSKSGNTARLKDAVLRGASHPEVSGVELRCLHARDAGPEDLRWADGVLLGTPENFGYMSGQLKDFFDRTYYEVEGELAPLPFAIFVSCGNDGRGAVREIQRIVRGYPFREVQDAVVVRGEITEEGLRRCEELGLALAAGLEAGIY